MKTTQHLIFYFLILISACGESITDLDSLIYQDSEDGLFKHKIEDDLAYSLRYIPIEKLAEKNLEEPLSKENYNDALEPFLDHHYMRLTISKTNQKDVLEGFNEEIKNKIRFYLTKHFFSVIDSKVVEASLYHFEPPIISSKGINFTIVFKDEGHMPNRSFSKDMAFRFQDDFFSKKTIEIKFDKEDLNNIPSKKL